MANWPAARSHAWRTLLRARAIENLSYVVAVNRIGEDGNGIAYSGDSAAVDFVGEDLLDCESMALVQTVTLSQKNLTEYRERFPAHQDADSFNLAD